MKDNNRILLVLMIFCMALIGSLGYVIGNRTKTINTELTRINPSDTTGLVVTVIDSRLSGLKWISCDNVDCFKNLSGHDRYMILKTLSELHGDLMITNSNTNEQ